MNVIQPLIELQDVDGRIRDLEREAKDIPQRKAQELARLKGVNAALEIAKNQLFALQQRVQANASEGEEIRNRVRDLKTAQLAIKSNKEMTQSILHIQGLESDADAAENRSLAIQEDEVPAAERRVAEAQAKVDAERGGVDGFIAELDERLAAVKTELAELQAERADKVKAVQAVDPKFLLYYERLSAKRWPVVVPLNDEGVCDGCHMKQPPYVAQLVQHNAAAANDPVRKQEQAVCTMCGRLLYNDL